VYFVPKFSYTYQIVKAIPMIVRKFIASSQKVEQNNSIWSTREGTLVAKHILDRFYEIAIANNSIPVVLFIPNVNDWKNGRKTPQYHDVKTLLFKDGSTSPLVIDIYDADFDESRFSVRPFEGHPSPYGNQVISSHVASELKKLTPVH